MSYYFERFGTLDLPDENPQSDISTAEANINTSRLPGGGIVDFGGDELGDGIVTTLYKRFTLVADNVGDMRDSFNALRALVGKKDWLYRRWTDNNYIEKTLVRLRKVSGNNTHFNMTHQDLVLEFDQLIPAWYGDQIGNWVLDSGEYLDSGLVLDGSPLQYLFNASGEIDETFEVDGNTWPRNLIVTVKTFSIPITSVTVALHPLDSSQPVAKWTFSGTIAAQKSIVVDTGRLSVKNDGAEDYANFDLHADHAVDRWHNLQPGTCRIVASKTGGSQSSYVELTYNEAWR